MKINKMKILVNSITIFRLISTFALISILNKVSSMTFLILISILFSTDFLDGALARKYEVQSFFGSWLDTIADKTLNIIIMLPLLKVSKLYYIIIATEVIILFINVIAVINKKMIQTLKVGKLKMWFIYIVVILGYISLFKSIPKCIINYSLYFTIILETCVIISYLYYELLGKNTSTFKFDKNRIMYCLFDTDYYKENK